MIFKAAQADMRYGFLNGAPGVFVSGLVWCIAGIASLLYSEQASMLTLFVGGMLIHPLAVLLSRAFKRPGKHRSDNPFAHLAIESTIILFVGLFLAFSIAQLKLNWFYPVMLLTIGVRYLLFNTLYGLKIYWLLGTVLMLGGVACMMLELSFAFAVFAGGLIEICFSFIIYLQSKDSPTIQ